MCAISSLTSTFAISSPDEFLFIEVQWRIHGWAHVHPILAKAINGICTNLRSFSGESKV